MGSLHVKRCGLGLLVCVAGLAFFLMPAFRKNQAVALQQDDDIPRKYLGAGTCSKCHSTWDKGTYPEPSVQLTEYTTWKEKDKHSRAYEVLTEARAKQMGQLLNINDVTKDPACLNCHSMNFVPEKARSKSFHIADGVTCDGCHGPSEDWLGKHVDWRDAKPAAKAKLGFVNIRDPMRRAEMCVSCHVGSTAEKKIVTHAMYAAGHPPLPSFELATFSASLPPHWRLLKDRPKAVREKQGYKEGELDEVKIAVLGGVATLRESMKLLASQAASDTWPDFGQFDCSACHHELERSSWRQRRGFAGAPGRPTPPTWSSALATLGVYAATNDDQEAGTLLGELKTRMAAVDAAFDARPFGDAPKIGEAAKDLATWSDGLLKKLDKRPFTNKVALRLLSKLADQARTSSPDFDSARQIAWAYSGIYKQLDPRPAKDADIQKEIAALDQELQLTLPSGRQRDILKALPSRFEAAAQYDPERLKKHFATLSELLGNS